MNLMQHFERIYIVNLPDRTDRRAEMDSELTRLNLKADGQQVRYFPAVRPDDAGDFPSVGSRGCFMSHLGIIEQAIRDDLDNVLIMEDDLAIDPSLAHAPKQMLDQLRRDPWDFAYFGHIASASPGLTVAPSWVLTKQPLATTHFYALNRSVFKALHEYLHDCLQRPSGHPLGSPMHVDGAYSLFRQQRGELVTLMASPSLGEQRSSRSDIFPNKWYDRVALTRQLASQLRSLKNWSNRKRGVA